MPPATAIDQHRPYLDHLAQAAQSSKGIRIKTPEPKALQRKLQYAREAERRYHKKVYPSDSPMHGRSFYENLIVRTGPGFVDILHSLPPEIQEVVEL
jgi:hypothetical protein